MEDASDAILPRLRRQLQNNNQLQQQQQFLLAPLIKAVNGGGGTNGNSNPGGTTFGSVAPQHSFASPNNGQALQQSAGLMQQFSSNSQGQLSPGAMQSSLLGNGNGAGVLQALFATRPKQQAPTSSGQLPQNNQVQALNQQQPFGGNFDAMTYASLLNSANSGPTANLNSNGNNFGLRNNQQNSFANNGNLNSGASLQKLQQLLDSQQQQLQPPVQNMQPMLNFNNNNNLNQLNDQLLLNRLSSNQQQNQVGNFVGGQLLNPQQNLPPGNLGFSPPLSQFGQGNSMVTANSGLSPLSLNGNGMNGMQQMIPQNSFGNQMPQNSQNLISSHLNGFAPSQPPPPLLQTGDALMADLLALLLPGNITNFTASNSFHPMMMMSNQMPPNGQQLGLTPTDISQLLSAIQGPSGSGTNGNAFGAGGAFAGSPGNNNNILLAGLSGTASSALLDAILSLIPPTSPDFSNAPQANGFGQQQQLNPADLSQLLSQATPQQNNVQASMMFANNNGNSGNNAAMQVLLDLIASPNPAPQQLPQQQQHLQPQLLQQQQQQLQQQQQQQLQQQLNLQPQNQFQPQQLQQNQQMFMNGQASNPMQLLNNLGGAGGPGGTGMGQLSPAALMSDLGQVLGLSGGLGLGSQPQQANNGNNNGRTFPFASGGLNRGVSLNNGNSFVGNGLNGPQRQTGGSMLPFQQMGQRQEV